MMMMMMMMMMGMIIYSGPKPLHLWFVKGISHCSHTENFIILGDWNTTICWSISGNIMQSSHCGSNHWNGHISLRSVECILDSLTSLWLVQLLVSSSPPLITWPRKNVTLIQRESSGLTGTNHTNIVQFCWFATEIVTFATICDHVRPVLPLCNCSASTATLCDCRLIAKWPCSFSSD